MAGHFTAAKVAKVGLAIIAVLVTKLPGCLSCNDLDQVTAPGPGVTILAPPGLKVFHQKEEGVDEPIVTTGQPTTFRLIDQGLGPGKPCPQMVKWEAWVEPAGADFPTQVGSQTIPSPPTHKLPNGDCVVGSADTPLTFAHTFLPGDATGEIDAELSANGDLDRNDGTLIVNVPSTPSQGSAGANTAPPSGSASTTSSTKRAPTDPDPTFGTNGTRLFTDGSNPTELDDVGQQSNTDLVVLGQFDCPGCPNSPSPFHYLERLNPDGTLDTTFNNGNLSPSGFFHPQKLLITPGDGIETVGVESGGKGDSVDFTHFNSGGTKDVSSSVTVGISTQIFAVVRQPSGKIDLVGRTLPLSASTFSGLIVQLKSDFTLDTGFGGGNGFITFQASVSSSSVNTQFFGGATQSNDQIIAGGEAGPAAGSDGLVAAFDGTTGAGVSGFGTNGTFLESPPSGGSASVGAVLTDGADRIVAASVENSSTDTTGVAFWRLTSSGGQDASFTRVVVPVPSGYSFNSWAGGMGIDPAGNLVLGGGATNFNGSGNQFPYMVRLTPNAQADSGFGTNGAFVDSATLGFVNTFAIQTDGKYLIGGHQQQGFLKRYFGAFGESGSPNVFGPVKSARLAHSTARSAHATARSAATRHRRRARTVTASGQVVGRAGSMGTPGYLADGNGVLRGASGSAKLDAHITGKHKTLRGIPVKRVNRLLHATLFAKGDVERYFAPPLGDPVLITGTGVARYPRGRTVGCFRITATPPKGNNAGSQQLTLLGGTGAAKGLRVTVRFPPLSIDRGVGSPKPSSLKVRVSRNGRRSLTPACSALLKQAPAP